MRWRTTVPIVVTLALALVSTVPAAAAMPPGFSANSKASVQGGSGWNEPAGVTGADNARYVSFQAPSRLSRATRASNWSETGFTAYDNAKPDGDLGDVTMAADRSGAVFLSHLTQNLQADIDYTRDGGATWQTAFNVAQLPFNPSAQPLAVDRPWIATFGNPRKGGALYQTVDQIAQCRPRPTAPTPTSSTPASISSTTTSSPRPSGWFPARSPSTRRAEWMN